MRKLSITVIGLIVVAWLCVLVHKTLAGFARPAGGATGAASGFAALPAAAEPDSTAYAVQLKPPVLHRGDDSDNVFAAQGIVGPGAPAKRRFVLPAMQRVTAMLLGRGVRYRFRAPSGTTIAPGSTPNRSGYEWTGEAREMPGFSGFTLDHPEAGEWTVTAEAKGFGAPRAYGIVLTSDHPGETARLESMLKDSDPAFAIEAHPGDTLYFRTFVARGGHPVSGVRWEVKAETPNFKRVRIATYDDGRHADGAANDGVSVGAVVAPGPDGVLSVVATGHVPGGATHTVSSFVQIESKMDLLIPDSITVEPASPKVGEPVTLTVTCVNDGTVDAHGVELELLLEQKTLYKQKFDLKAGESRRVATPWTPTTPGVQVVQLSIEPWLEPSSSDFANNTRRATVTVR